MTRDAFYKAQELDHKLHMVFVMRNILGNSTLSDKAEDEFHNERVKKEKIVLCYMCEADDSLYKTDAVLKHIENGDGDTICGDYHMGGNFVYGKDIPIDLVKALERTLWEYEEKIQAEFDALTDNYESEEE